MSLRSALRSKFRPNPNDKGEEADASIKYKSDNVTISNASATQASEEEEHSPESRQDLSTGEWHSFEDKEVFEMQLSNLHEQLVSTMITNQRLTKELEQVKEEKYVHQIYKQLEEEKNKNLELKERVVELEEESMNERRVFTNETEGIEGIIENGEPGMQQSNEHSPPPSRTHTRKLHLWLQEKMMTVLQDFSDDTDLEVESAPAEEELSVRKLKENMRRFKSGSEPPLLYFKVVSALLSWRSPASTLLAFMLYMYSIYSGWFLTVLFGLILWHFSKTYLISRGWNIEFSLLPYHTLEEDSEEDKTLGMSDKFQLVLQVAKKAQNLLGEVADSLEKLQNLVNWSDVEVTKSLYKNILGGFIFSIFFPASTLFMFTGLFIGIKLFIISYLFRRYPRLKQKYDTTKIMWKKLPTNEQKLQRQIVAQRRQYLVNVDGIRPSTSQISQASESNSQPDVYKAFTETFKLPNNEGPLQGWEDGKRSTLIQREKALATAFRSGKLYLTKSYLCFKRSRIFTTKNIIIPLCDVTKLEKIKPFSFMPGSGMSIKVHVSSVEKPFVFGAILNRDEVYEEILQVAKESQLAWSKDTGSDDEQIPSDEVDGSD